MDRERYTKLKSDVSACVQSWMCNETLRFYWEPHAFRQSKEVAKAVTDTVTVSFPDIVVETVHGFWIGPIYKPCAIHPDCVGYEKALQLQSSDIPTYEESRSHCWLSFTIGQGECAYIDPSYMQFTNSSTFDFEEALYHGSWHCLPNGLYHR